MQISILVSVQLVWVTTYFVDVRLMLLFLPPKAIVLVNCRTKVWVQAYPSLFWVPFIPGLVLWWCVVGPQGLWGPVYRRKFIGSKVHFCLAPRPLAREWLCSHLSYTRHFQVRVPLLTGWHSYKKVSNDGTTPWHHRSCRNDIFMWTFKTSYPISLLLLICSQMI